MADSGFLRYMLWRGGLVRDPEEGPVFWAIFGPSQATSSLFKGPFILDTGVNAAMLLAISH